MNQRRITIYSFIYRGLSAGLTFVNSAIAARYLPVALRGEYQTSVTYSSSGQSFSGGYSNYFSWSLPRRPEDTIRIVQMGNFVMFLLSIFVWLIAGCVAWFGHPSQIVLYALLTTPLSFLFGYGSRLLNSLGEISWLNRANIAQAVSFLVIYSAFAISHLHASGSTKLGWTFKIWLLSWAISVGMTLFVAYRKLGARDAIKWKWSNEEWRGLRSFGTWSSLALLSGYVNYRTDFWMVSIMTMLMTHDRMYSDSIVSIYGIAVTAAEILNTLTQSISTMVFHRVTAANSNDAGAITEVATRQTLVTSTGLAIALAAVVPALMVIYSWKKYGGAIGPFYILLPGLILKASANVISQYFTNSKGKPRTLLFVNMMVIAFNAILCFFLIPLLGMYGASIASSVAYLFEMSVYVYWYNRVSERKGRDLWVIRRSDLQPYMDVLRGVRRRVAGRQG
ncbi:polysaccharide biosynthesis C-terminal domain-containing protein [Alicyclobacillus dauci]|uniref:Polysaccharide biosynthesis C-terminal domain-containing protein n=1 Tax=Alicyclobacillus dauci TaxID=1475485 RepID=A0ABY6Z0M7_9BACL|nr:polysaccharide biosynthesis C-terminal domain-containing protein [Alicyclobacillus dauci]WAH36392.1 polysaccharide biosynthesis C-terminal domain-containing protein [Alicyclobacillus dauci]